MTKRLFDIDPWLIRTHKLATDDMRLQESLTAIGNGYMGLRGNFEEGYSGDSLRGTYYGGVWFPDKTRVGWWKIGYPEYFGKAINGPDFISMPLTINNVPIDLAQTPYHDFYLSLDMHNAVLHREFVVDLPDTQVQLSFDRFMSNDVKQAAVIRMTATTLQGNADIRVESQLNSNVHNEDSNYEEMFWEELDRHADSNGTSHLTVITKPNPYDVPRFSLTLSMTNVLASPAPATRTAEDSSLLVQEDLAWHLAEGESSTLTKYVTVVTSRDVPTDQQVAAGEELMQQVVKKGYDALLAAQNKIWQERWNMADVVIAGDDVAQQGIRFNLVQLFMTYYGDDARLNIGPKGFTGEKYGGATYWDTEAYIVPMYLSVTPPKVVRQLLEYRYNQLSGAYHNAQQQGLKGALFPMVTFNGIESHNEWEITFEEIHRNGAIAHAIAQYTEYTGDHSYVDDHGIEVLVGIARFWADRVHFSKRQGKYMIHGVTGPNEYENNVNNNWYTNTMATWTLRYTLKMLPEAKTSQLAKLQVSDEEKAHWQDIIDRMYYPEDEKLGIFVQNDTFLDKDVRPASSIPADQRPINQHWSWDRILRSPFIKQADVLQGIYFLNDEFTMQQKERNFDFYEPLTVHESSLSPSIHAILAAELGKQDKAVELYQRTARLDLDNYNNDTDDGLHITSMSGSWLAIVQGFAGMRQHADKLSFKPFLPKNWEKYAFAINYRDRIIRVSVNAAGCTLQLLKGAPLTVWLYDKPTELSATVHE
ncbi:glycoside hydrolase family 65 protein [Schleiferilactobacillus harbinensis]|jgi:maltose phosphorylase|uniref:Maltosephosphorylase n=1 Tax=Schleiferilactobacillus harbinensis DSM 16991 TaxID=1122147 RepID=A0A0R1X0D2_9LACO|nr:glycoside hydrolase family 65 protein [Schleiferilactobacillus harbinensis]KRM23521.1 maltosephosphorylase [Schleiferilactobacillus harbinensis DSM 16991]MCI1850336.1 glycoside hydrolase family 65 protein [Schleiferilactobacillus harbinensis]QFR65327.1 glycoside hydrolase family 65 protein [Schleiferilactobacillus harbinensis]